MTSTAESSARQEATPVPVADAAAAPIEMFPYDRWEPRHEELAARYQSASPYPHLALTNFINEDLALRLAEEFPAPDGDAWTAYKHYNENKFGNTKRALFPQLIGRMIDEFNSPRFVAFLSRLTGIQGLMPDPSLEGGGMHQTPSGGFLNVHADFTMHHHQTNWRRRCNLILYLNPGWDTPNWGGAIQLWDQAMTRAEVEVPPVLNQAVLFNTTETTYHGYPERIRCPQGVTRKSLALYYFTQEPQGAYAPRATNYRATPKDGMIRRAAIWADKRAVSAYTLAKRKLGLSDDFASRVLRFLSRKK